MELLRLIKIPMAAIFAVLMIMTSAHGDGVRVKQLAYVRGVRDNQLVGYGIVVGLNGTGDSNKSVFTMRSVASMLAHYGITVSEEDMKLENAAAVMLTATIPAFAGNGDRLDVTVSSLGDAESLQGGMLLQTPLQAANGLVYAVAQGALTIGGFNAGGSSRGVQQNHPTVGRVPGGAIVERDINSDFVEHGELELVLHDADFTTAERLATTINNSYGADVAHARNAGSVKVTVPAEYADNAVGFISALENLSLRPDVAARVVVNERTGTVVLGGDVQLSACAVSHGNLSITITTETTSAMQATPYAMTSQTNENQQVSVEEETNRLLMLNAGTQVAEVVDALNSIGATPRDIISILQAIQQAGALHAELVVM